MEKGGLMRNESYRQVSLIEDESLLELEKKINKRMQELAGCSPELDVDVKARYAVITYTSCRDIAETIKDEYNKKGVRFSCSQCPFLEIDSDKRKKRYPCSHSEVGFSRIDSDACEDFYKWVDEGKIIPKAV